MKPSVRLPRPGLLALLCPVAALAQSAPTPPATPAAAADTTITLSAFEVTSAKDSGYRVQNAVATTGIAQALIDTPLPITVVTEEFMRDAGLRGFTGAVSYVSSIATDPHAANGNYAPGAGVSQGNLNRFRGQAVNGTFRNGLRLSHGFDTENVDRVEVAKGPLAVFVGGATLGGEVNVVTKVPQFARRNELTFSVGSHETYSAAADLTGPINAGKTLAYRVLASYRDANTWRDHSDTQTRYLSPQLLWRPNAKLSVRLDYAHRFSEGNLVSQNVSDTGNYQADFDNPRPFLLELGRTTSLGRPYTVDEYRARIGQAFGNWRQDVFDVTGRWVTLGEGLGLVEGNFPGGRAANSYGPNADFTERSDLVENETTFAVTEWLQARFIGRIVKSYVSHNYFSFSQRLMPAGSYNLTSGYQGRRFHEDTSDAKLETVIKRPIWIADFTLLLGGQYGENKNYNETAVFDYSGLAPVPGSPNVFGTPATLTGANILNFFDPRVHAVPNYESILTWADETLAPGVTAQSYSRTFPEAGYAAYSGSFWKDRITAFAGYRNSVIQQSSYNLDRNRGRLTRFLNSPKTSTQSHTLGLVFEPFSGLNLYVSQNIGTEAVPAGSLINAAAGFTNLVTTEERAANPVPDLEGRGREAGIKVELFNRKLIGRVGVFDLSRRNTVIIDNERTATDSRNVGTAVDPNPATQNLAQTPRVQWNRTIDGNKSSGVEVGFTWMPNRNYTVNVEASHLWTNKLTLSRPLAGTAPTAAAAIDYAILNGRPLDNTPDDTLRIWQRYSFTEGRLKSGWAGLGIRAQTSLMPLASNSSWGTVLPGWTVFDAAFGYRIQVANRPIDLQLNVENLTDKLYSSGGRTWSPPRTWTFQATTRF
jgi:outer membrane receptor protein involved in Fe transport